MRKIVTSTVVFVLLAAMLLGGCGSGKKELMRGVWNDNKYTSDYAGLSFDMPEGWMYASDEEIAAIMEVSADIVAEAGMQFSKQMLELQTIYDIIAQNPVTGTNVVIMYDNLSMIVGGSKYTGEEYLKVLKAQLESLPAGYTFGDITETKLGGDNYTMLNTTVVSEGAEIKQYYYVKKIDNYMFCVIISLRGGESIETVEARFS